ncbi:MAG: amidohydrolase [Pseudomonadales bacterium]|nr:amidohydrolase [Pseudomonadales bacterium]
MIPRGIISADGHVCEPANCYVDFIDPKYKADAPRRVVLEGGMEAFEIAGMKKPTPLGFIDGAGYSIKERAIRAKTLKFSDVREGAYKGNERTPYMDQDGIAAELIYPSVGMGICMHRDAEYKNACMHAYNRWLQTLCAEQPYRIFGLAQTAVMSVDRAIKDFEMGKELGMVGMMMPGDPVYEDYDHPDYDALWQCATDLDMPIAFHILTSRAGSLHTKPRGHSMNGFLSIIRAVQDVVGLMVYGGVFERHPKLKLVVAESDVGWIPHYMTRMDHSAKLHAEGGIIKGLSKLPSEYVKNNVYGTFQDDVTAYHSLYMMNYKNILWASDFPHTDSTWPRSQQLIREQTPHLTEEQKQAIFRDNTAALFNLPAGKKSWRMKEEKVEVA